MLDLSPSNCVAAMAGLMRASNPVRLPKHLIVDRALHRAAARVSQNQHDLGAGGRTAIFKTAKDVIVGYVASDARVEYIADSGIEDDLGRHARIHAAQNYRRGILSPLCCSVVRRDNLAQPSFRSETFHFLF